MFLGGPSLASAATPLMMSQAQPPAPMSQSTAQQELRQHPHLACNDSGTCQGGSCAANASTVGSGYITASSVYLYGTGPSCATSFFRYSTTASTACTSGAYVTLSSWSGGNSTAVLTGLLPSTTYYFCAHSETYNGGYYADRYIDDYGALLSFNTLNTAPAVVTGSETGVTATGATLNGTVDPNGDSTTYYYRWAVAVAGATCASLSHVTAYTAGNGGAGQTPINRPVSITGLSSGTYYYYCIVAGNSAGVRYGAIASLTASGSLPQLVTSAATLIDDTGATFNGSVDPNGLSTTAWFRYDDVTTASCSTTFGTQYGGWTYSGAVPVALSRAITTLVPNTTYYYCAIGTNSSGTGKGTVLTFRTPGPPDIVTQPEDSITETSANLNGTVDPNGLSSTVWFRYSTTNGTCNGTFGTQYGGWSGYTGTADIDYARAITGLTPNTTYYYCAVGSNSAGTTYGTMETFSTPPLAPIITTDPATSVTNSSAVLNGTINPQGTPADVWYRWGSTNGGGNCNSLANLTASTLSGSGSSAVAIPPFSLSSLSLSTTYYFCAFGLNDTGTNVIGTMRSFTTSAALPTITTDSATSITSSGGILNGRVNPNSATIGNRAWLRYSTINPGTCNDTFGTRYGTWTYYDTVEHAIPYALNGTPSNTTYYYCYIGGNPTETLKVYGSMASFTTASPAAQCADGLDNDGDGFVDMLDSGCSVTTDTSETIVTPMALSATPSRVRSGDTATLNYDTGGRTLCRLTGNGQTSGILSTSPGTFTTTVITTVTTYTLSCTGDTATKQIVIQLVPSVIEI